LSSRAFFSLPKDPDDDCPSLFFFSVLVGFFAAFPPIVPGKRTIFGPVYWEISFLASCDNSRNKSLQIPPPRLAGSFSFYGHDLTMVSVKLTCCSPSAVPWEKGPVLPFFESLSQSQALVVFLFTLLCRIHSFSLRGYWLSGPPGPVFCPPHSS